MSPQSADLASEPPQPAEPPPRATLLNIQALRALAAFMVVCVHLDALAVMAGAPPERMTVAGNGGVDLFFVISGFIMVFTTGRKPMGPLDFLAARLRRIAPLYWSMTLAVFLVARLAPHLIQNTPADLGRLLAALSFVPALRPDGTIRPVVFVGWTLNFEMAFYVLFALGLLAAKRWVGVIATVAMLGIAVTWGWMAKPSSPVLAFYTTPMVAEFGLGMLLGLAWPRLNPPRWAVWPLAVAALAAFALMLAGPSLWPQLDRLFVFGLPATVIVAASLALDRQGRAVRWRWVKTMGAASYAIYLSHFFVTQAVVLLARKAHLHGPLEAGAMAALALLGVGLVGLALHRSLEQGAERLIGWMLARKPAPPTLGAPILPKVKSVS